MSARTWRGRQIAIPYIVLDELIVPPPLSRTGVERHKRVGEYIVPKPVARVEIEGCRPSGNEDNAALRIERHTRPVVSAA